MSHKSRLKNIIQGCLVEAVITDWDIRYLRERQHAVLGQVHQCGVGKFILDVSAVESIDSLFIKYVADTMSMVSLLGARVVLTGIGPGLAASFVAFDFELRGIKIAPTVDGALAILASKHCTK